MREVAMRVLVVDDDETFCQFLAEVLTAKGLDVERTTDGYDAYNRAQQHPFDLYISDVCMPSLCGTELAEKIKQTDPQAKIILISAFLDSSLTLLEKNPGIRLLSKPFSTSALWQTISAVTGVHASSCTVSSAC